MRRWLAVGAISLVGGCLQAGAVLCDNGAICRPKESCTELPVCSEPGCVQDQPLCGPSALVEQCFDDAKAFGPCTVATQDDGVCVDRVCTTCTSDLAGCGSAQWEQMTIPDGTPLLSSVWVVSRTNAYAGGKGATMLEYDGRKWQRMTAFPATPAVNEVNRVFATGPSDVYAVVDNAVLYHYDGTAWTQASLPSGADAIKAVHGTSPSNVYAVGFSGTIVHFDGTKWDPTNIGAGPTLNGVVATSTGAIAVGSSGFVSEWDGSSVTTTQLPAGVFHTAQLDNVFLDGAKVLAQGPSLTSGQPTLLERVGGTWSASPLDSTLVMVPVYCAADDWGGSGTGRTYHYDGTTWLSGPRVSTTGQISGIAHRDGYGFAVGAGVWRLKTP